MTLVSCHGTDKPSSDWSSVPINSPNVRQIANRMRATAPPGVTIAATSLTALYDAPGSGGIGVLGEGRYRGDRSTPHSYSGLWVILAVLPLILAGVSILATFLTHRVVTALTSVRPARRVPVALVRSRNSNRLFPARRYALARRARSCRANDEAIVVAMSTAGRSVAFSGVTVGIGLLSLILLPVPFLRGLGYGGLLIPLVTVIAALTLLPVLLQRGVRV